MENKNRQEAGHVPAGALGGARQQNPPIDVDCDVVWHVMDRIAMTVPTFRITIQVRHEVEIEIEGDVAAVGRDGITIMSGDRRIDIDHRYNSAVEKRRGGAVVVSNTVRYRGIIYEAKEFATLFKSRVKELMLEAFDATVGI
jgi:hypothetical protein